MAEAKFHKGNPEYVNYTTDVNTTIAAGQVVVVGHSVYVAHQTIAPSTTGSLAALGGTYQVTANAAITGGVTVYWNDTNNKVVTNSSGNERFGFALPDTDAADGDLMYVLHIPGPGT